MKRCLIILALISLCGCASYLENKQLSSINKDWNRLIRASHIYPVYPLSQDILPGDIFFVSTDIEDLSAWKQPGYLPLDHLVARLYPANYVGFYSNSWPEFTNNLPHRWLGDNSWSNAPVAGFPSYSFTVKQGGGANVALPIQGIPVGLSLIGAKSASGYVALTDAHTYGIDEVSLREQVWNYVTNNEALFRFLIPADDPRPHYLQVVSRVYTVGQVTVSMINDSSLGVTAWGGSPKDVNTPTLQTNDPVANFTNIVSAVNANVPSAEAAKGILPGGTLKFSSVTSRSVSMNETFPKPIVIGYTGFSFQISRTNWPTKNGFRPGVYLGESIISNEKLLHKLHKN